METTVQRNDIVSGAILKQLEREDKIWNANFDMQKIWMRENLKASVRENARILRRTNERREKIERQTMIFDSNGSMFYAESFYDQNIARIVGRCEIEKIFVVYTEDQKEGLFQLIIKEGESRQSLMISISVLQNPRKLMQVVQTHCSLLVASIPAREFAEALATYVIGKIDWENEIELFKVPGWHRVQSTWKYVSADMEGALFGGRCADVHFHPNHSNSGSMEIFERFCEEYGIFRNAADGGLLMLIRLLAFLGEFFRFPSYERIFVLDTEDALGDEISRRYLQIMHADTSDIICLDEIKPAVLCHILKTLKDDIISIRMPKTAYSVKVLRNSLLGFLNEETLGNENVAWRGIPVIISRKAAAMELGLPAITIHFSASDITRVCHLLTNPN